MFDMPNGNALAVPPADPASIPSLRQRKIPVPGSSEPYLFVSLLHFADESFDQRQTLYVRQTI